MLAVIRCKPCAIELGRVERESPGELGLELGAMLIGCHSRHPHCGHALEVDFGDEGPPSGVSPALDRPVALEVRCLCPPCLADGKKLATDAPRWLVGALTIVFHTSHEGHPLELVIDGRAWRSPGT